MNTKTMKQWFVAVACAFCISAHAVADTPKKIDVPPGQLIQALKTLGAQSGVEFVYSTDQLTGLSTKGVHGELTAEQALARLLEGTNLKVTTHQSGALLISAAGKPLKTSEVVTTAAGMRLAHGDDPQSAEAMRKIEQGSPKSSVSSESEDQNSKSTQEIVVTGSHIRGVYPSSSPVQIYSAEDIRRTGATTTEQFIGKLPQNLGTVSPHGSASAAREAVSGVDLRGLGVGTTLVLVNGRRLSLANRGQTADISTIPMSAIARVEVLTDGASAIYGSDAIGGVVNFVLREDFEGAETRLFYGGSTGGGLNQAGVTQTFGRHWNSGHALMSYDFMDAGALARSERDYARAAAPGTLTPDEQRHNLLATASQNITDRLTVSGDVVLGQRDIESSWSQTSSVNPLNHLLRSDATEVEQNLFALDIDYDLTDSLRVSLGASYSKNETERNSITTRINDSSVAPALSQLLTEHEIRDTTAMLEGSLFELGGGKARFSLGAGLLDEDYRGANQNGQATGSELGRRTTSVFAEVFAPLIGPGQNIAWVHRLELSLAGRYTDTEDTTRPVVDRDFGDATDPKIGIFWAPTRALGFRGTYGTSFRAPPLLQIDPVAASNFQIFESFPVPFPTGPLSRIFVMSGTSIDLKSETAETYTVGIDFQPEFRPGLKLSATYYFIDYTDRIAVPDAFGLDPFITPSAFPELMTRQPSAATLQRLLAQSNPSSDTIIDLSTPAAVAAAAAAFAADPNFWVYDGRRRNLALSRQDGIDVGINDRFDIHWGELRLGANLTYILDYRQRPLSDKPVVTILDKAGFPVNLRGRVFAGLSRGGFDGTLGVNYVDDYLNAADSNNPGNLTQVDSWTTVDLNVSYDFTREGSSGLLNGMRANLSIQNVFDRDPPFVVRPFPDERFGFDPQNANPLGRIVVLGVSKQWGR